jgi:hypothetical protein
MQGALDALELTVQFVKSPRDSDAADRPDQ